jgi:hypothetical protein
MQQQQQQQPVQPVHPDRLRTQALDDVRHNGRALEYAAEHLKGDREIVLEAVRQDGAALLYAAEHLRGDREIVLDAVRQYVMALEYAAAHLRDDGSFLYELRELTGYHRAVGYYASPRIQGEMAKDPGYLERYAPVQDKPARQDTYATPTNKI